MAARRITQSAVNWAAIMERIPQSHAPKFAAMRARSDQNLRKMMSLPEKPPAIDWAFYKSKVANPAIVEAFQKKYAALQIPFPPDTVTSQINELEKELSSVVKVDIEESNARIKEYEAKLAHIASQIPASEMTYQEFFEAYPEESLDVVNNPTCWPHDPEEIREHEEDMAREAKGEKPAH